jgi:hypothetical protein
MKQSIWTSGSPSNPQAFITKRKQRIKQFEGQVYLNDGDTYEIELFNPTPSFVLAKIKLDSNYISKGGIVLRPGERVFLERFLDSNNQFVFRTYEVSKKNKEVQEAIANNGYVEIEFYNEEPIIPQRTFYGGTGTVTWTNYSQPVTYTTSNSGTFTLTGVNTTSTSNAFYNASSNTQQVSAKSLLNDSKMETGVTEKGGSTNQSFTQSDRNFYSYSFWNVAWRILPNSHKQYHAEEVNVMYCGECGAKRKKDTHKFCPHCGTKY